MVRYVALQGLFLVAASAYQAPVRMIGKSAESVILDIKVSAADFRNERLSELAKDLRARFGDSSFVTATVSITGEAVTPLVTHVGYKYFRSAADWGRENISSALFLGIHGDAVLLISRPGQKVEKRIIAGSDPTVVNEASCVGELLFIGLDISREVVAYLQADKDQNPTACHLALRERFALRSTFRTEVRSDPWFFGSGARFPVVYMFTRAPVPAYNEWKVRRTYKCEGIGKDARCERILATMRE